MLYKHFKGTIWTSTYKIFDLPNERDAFYSKVKILQLLDSILEPSGVVQMVTVARFTSDFWLQFKVDGNFVLL